MSRTIRALLAARLAMALLVVVGGRTSQAANGTWLSTNPTANPAGPAQIGQNWSDPTRWVSSIIAGTVGTTTSTDTLYMNTDGHYTITLDGNYNVQNLYHNVVNHRHAIVTNGTSTLVLTNGGSVTGSSGNVHYYTPIRLEGGSGGAYTFSQAQLSIFGTVSGTAATGGNYDLILAGGGIFGTSGAYVGSLADGAGGGTLSVIKTGTGTWSLQTASTYTGTTTVRNGTLRFTYSSSFGASTSPIQLGDSGTAASDNIELRWNENETLSRNVVVNNSNPSGTTTLAVRDNRGSPQLSGTLTLNRNLQVMNTNSGHLHISGKISGTGGLIKDGADRLYLSGLNDFTGGVTINAGTVYAKDPTSTTVLGTGRLTMTGGTFSLHSSDGQNPASQTVGSIAGTGGSIRAGNRTLTFGGDNSDSVFQGGWDGGTFTKTGSGTTTVFSAGSTVTGLQGVNVNAGTLQLGASKNFNTTVNVYGTLDLNGYSTNGDLHIYAGGAVTTAAGTFTSTAAQQYFHNAGTSTFTGNWAVPTNPNFRGDANSVLIIDGVLSGGSGTITHSGNMQASALIRLSGSVANTFTGTWAVGNGTTELNKTAGVDAIPTDVSMSSGTLKWLASDQIADTATLTFAGGNLNLNGFNETVARLASPGTGAFQPNSAGTLTLAASSGDLISIGTGSNISKDVGLNLALSGSGGGILFTPDPVNQNRVMRIGTATAGERTLDLGAVDRTIDVTANSSNVNLPSGYEAQISSQVTGTGGIIKNGVGDLQLTAANTFSGDTLVNAGRLIVSTNLALQNSALDTSGAGTVTLTSATTPTLGGLKGSTNLASVITSGYGSVTALILNPGTGKTHAYSGTIANGSGNTSLTKSGAGTQILAGTNTYTGTTNITGGTLMVNGNHTGGGSYTVGAGATLGGTGVIDPAAGATVSFTGAVGNPAILSPGASIDTLTIGSSGSLNNVVLGANSLLAVELDIGGTCDLLNVFGNIDLSATGNTVTFEGTAPNGGMWYTIATTNGGSVTGTFEDIRWSGPINILGMDYSGGLIRVFAIPEPSALALLALAGLALGARRKSGIGEG